MSNEIIVDCPTCTVRIKTKIEKWVGDARDAAYVLTQCPTCDSALFGRTFIYRDDFGNDVWNTVDRLWPAQASTEIASAIPEAARKDIKDAQKCISHGIYSAAAVLCGRALERLIHEKASAKMIGKGLAELKAKGVIDDRLHNWAEALRKERNIGAHASDSDITHEDASDVVDFTIAIFDYVYTLSEKYELYMNRKNGKSGGS